jgi:lia operon protein LiaG
MRRSLVTLALAVVAPIALTAQSSSERHVLNGERVSIWNIAGRAEVVAGTGRDVIVELTRGGDDGRRLTVEASAGRMVVRYPSREIVYRDRTDSHRWEVRLQVAEDGTFSSGWDDDRDGRSVRVRSTGGGLEAHADLRIQVPQGQSISLYVGVGEIEASNVNGEIELRTNASPIRGRDIQGRLTARTGSGRIVLENVNVERAHASTGSGSIELLSVTTRELRVNTGSGSIEGRTLRGDRLDASTGSGGIRLDDVTSTDVRATTGSGSIRVDLVQTPNDITARTGSGGVTLRFPSGMNAEVDIRTGSGGISTDFPVTMDQVRRNELRGRIGDGTGGRLRVNTGSGSVRLERR